MEDKIDKLFCISFPDPAYLVIPIPKKFMCPNAKQGWRERNCIFHCVWYPLFDGIGITRYARSGEDMEDRIDKLFCISFPDLAYLVIPTPKKIHEIFSS